LNTARVSQGLQNNDMMTRITMFKRKQTTPERLIGRELLRRYDFLSDQPYDSKKKKVISDEDGRPICDYNVHFCMTCPDCISYGFAIGDSGSEKSKIISDTAYSLTDYADSHEAFTLNAPYESGTMSRQGETTSRINEQDHVKPQTFFPSVITIRDTTGPLFEYVLNNVIRTRHYGAQTTRTGSMTNHILAIALTDGEIFSNLKFTQALYDTLGDQISPPNPVDAAVARQAAAELIPNLLQSDGVTVDQLLMGEELTQMLTAFNQQLGDASAMKSILEAAFSDSRVYHNTYISK
jgi:CRISPR-associated protein Csc2